MNIYRRSVLSLVVCVLLSGQSWADIIIDDFEVGPAVLMDTTPGAGTEYATQSGLSTQHVAGGVRHLDLYGYSTPTGFNIGSGSMAMISSQYGSTYFNVIYNANPSSGGGTPNLNLDLSGMQSFELTFNRVDNGMSCLIYVRSGTITGSSYLSVTAPGTLTADLTSFSSSINWADVDSIRLELRSSRYFGGGDQVESMSDFRVVPEPAGVVLLSVVAVGLLGRRAR